MLTNLVYSVGLLSYSEGDRGWRVSTKGHDSCHCHRMMWPRFALTYRINKPHYTICPLGRRDVR